MSSSFSSSSSDSRGMYGANSGNPYMRPAVPGPRAVPPRVGGYPPINIRSVKPYPADPYMDQVPLPEALRVGTLFRWLIDPYENPYGE